MNRLKSSLDNAENYFLISLESLLEIAYSFPLQSSEYTKKIATQPKPSPNH